MRWPDSAPVYKLQRLVRLAKGGGHTVIIVDHNTALCPDLVFVAGQVLLRRAVAHKDDCGIRSLVLNSITGVDLFAARVT